MNGKAHPMHGMLPLIIAACCLSLVLIGATAARLGFRRGKKATDA
ncbi:hypothetical protein Acsp01_11430 [Actinoplanes sp. NBRC 101535]|nr:hypothetical protein Acsp01_11430 [Actinoplanes sp. NBRC 101535]